MIVMKFGGTSLKDAGRIKQVGSIVRGQLAQKPIVIASAHHGVTEKLIALARKETTPGDLANFHLNIARRLGVSANVLVPVLAELKEFAKTIPVAPSKKELDRLMSFGERLSVRTIAAYFNRHHIPAQYFDAGDIGLLTDGNFGHAHPLPQCYKLIARKLKPVVRKNIVPVITGFIGRDINSNTTTLGRNGSDFTATIVAAALGAKEVQLWSDRAGIMTADPQMVPNTRLVTVITFTEAGELAYYSRRFHPSTLLPAIHKKIPVRILNAYKPESPGTAIVAREKIMPAPKSIVYKKDIYLITITSPRMLMQYGFLEKIFKVFARRKIVIDMIATSEVSVSVTTDSRHDLKQALKDLQAFASVRLQDKQAIICVVGEGIRKIPALSGDIFSALKTLGVEIKMISQGAARTNIAFLVDNSRVKKSIRALHQTLFG